MIEKKKKGYERLLQDLSKLDQPQNLKEFIRLAYSTPEAQKHLIAGMKQILVDLFMDTHWKETYTKHRLRYHVVWIPKHPKRTLIGTVADRIKRVIEEGARTNGWRIHEIGIENNHVHLQLQIGPNISVAKAVQVLKQGSSHKLRREFPELEEFFWGEDFWEDGFFAESIGVNHDERIEEYIKEQRKDVEVSLV
jgi:putative transposase